MSVKIEYNGRTYIRMNASIPGSWEDSAGHIMTSKICEQLDYIVNQAHRKYLDTPTKIVVNVDTRINMLIGSLFFGWGMMFLNPWMPAVIMISTLMVDDFLKKAAEQDG